MRIAVLYICTGNYHIFWESFYRSAQQYFLPAIEKHYFLFTDHPFQEYDTDPRVHLIYQEKLGWPYDTLMRFDMFLKAEEKLSDFDYIFFLNANIIFVDQVNEEVLPDVNNNGLMGVQHPYFTWVTHPKDFPYERNRKSRAFIRRRRGDLYFMGGFNGGAGREYLTLIRTLDKNIKADLGKGIIARWHDESHLNSYFLGREVNILPPQYGCPEGMEGKFPGSRIIILNKEKFGGHDFLRKN